jgi:hypothetical protein
MNLKTWQCDLLTQAAGVTLAGTSPVVLPDGRSGFWVVADQYLLYTSGEKWQVAYAGVVDATIMGLTQADDLCLGVYKPTHRGFSAFWQCFEGSELPLSPPKEFEDCFIKDCPFEPTNCATWQRVSGKSRFFAGGTRGYGYTTQDKCERTQQIMTTFASSDSVCAQVAFAAEGNEVWVEKTEFSENAQLLYQRDEIWHQEETVDHVTGLTADHVHGGAWLAMEDRLVHVEIESADGGAPSDFIFRSVSVDFQIPSLDVGSFPGEARGLATDKAGRAWAVNGESALLYDEAAKSWQEVASPRESADAITADSERGVWVAGRGELVHLDGVHQQAWLMPDTLTDTPTALLIDSSGRVWMGTAENGVWTAMPSEAAGGRALA